MTHQHQWVTTDPTGGNPWMGGPVAIVVCGDCGREQMDRPNAYEQGQRDERAKWDAVRNAWLIEGPRPDYHREAKRELMRRWPTLARALSAVIDAGGES